MPTLTTHVLNTAAGTPAAGMSLELYHLDGPDPGRPLRQTTTNATGRTDHPLLDAEAGDGAYELRFDVAGYFEAMGHPDAGKFLGHVPLMFRLSGGGHYHVPLLVSPWSYSTYRGS